MRTLRLLLLIVALIAGQAQVCRAVYRCPDGSVCKTCPDHPCPTQDETCRGGTLSKKHVGSCCTLSTGDDRQEADLSVSQPPFELPDCMLVERPALQAPQSIAHRPARLLWLTSHRPQAPPGELSLRAPPFLLG